MNAHLPSSDGLQAEQALLGAALHHPAVIDQVRGIIAAGDIGEPVHRLLFQAMARKRDEGGTFDAPLLRMLVEDLDLGGLTVGEYIGRLHASATTIGHAVEYAKEIRRQADRRRLWGVAHDIKWALDTPVGRPADVAASAIEMLDEIVASAPGAGPRCVNVAEAADQVLAEIGRIRGGGKRAGAPYGMPSLDRMTLGMKPGELIIAAGRPGMGKSTFGIAVGLNTSERNAGTYYVSLEMEAQQLTERALAALAFDDLGNVLTYRTIGEAVNLTDKDLWRLQKARDRLKGVPLSIEQQPGLTLSQIGARARQRQARMEREGKHLRLIIVDHLGLVRPSTRYSGNRVQEVSEITAGLKVLAKELGVAVMALCQLSRGIESREDKRPTLSDLRDSGSIEQDADLVLGLYREAYYLERKLSRTDEEDERLLNAQQELVVEILKQRQGPTGSVRLFCSAPCNVVAEKRA
ncbi:replicative DNA helicase [Alsobacter metallidurans]|uniref:replicative DNA helicase n=1 Tax=Alsobacter metallidurans TaxID=340221 RepID=UPI00166CCEC9|nr:DnaB-like helicase C-terminal domain-containing protein [Alsobacter metallidurans]